MRQCSVHPKIIWAAARKLACPSLYKPRADHPARGLRNNSWSSDLLALPTLCDIMPRTTQSGPAPKMEPAARVIARTPLTGSTRRASQPARKWGLLGVHDLTVPSCRAIRRAKQCKMVSSMPLPVRLLLSGHANAPLSIRLLGSSNSWLPIAAKRPSCRKRCATAVCPFPRRAR